MAAFAWLIVAHGGTAGLVVEIITACGVGLILLWAAVQSRRADSERKD